MFGSPERFSVVAAPAALSGADDSVIGLSRLPSESAEGSAEVPEDRSTRGFPFLTGFFEAEPICCPSF